MNSLLYRKIADVAADLRSGKTIEDGTVIVAHCATIEVNQAGDDLATVEAAFGRDWSKTWGDGSYHYELLVARQGTTPVTDAYGDEFGFAVVGTKRKCY